MVLFPAKKTFYTTLGVLSVVVLSACGGGSNPEKEEHEKETINTLGRLSVSELNTPVVRMHDLDSASFDSTSFTLENVPSALYASPGGRYVMAPQRNNNQVQFIDGGIWQENHVDHFHDYKNSPRSIAWKLLGSSPTHFNLQAGKQGTFFMDGNQTTNPIQNAGVRLLSDASIAQGNTPASLDLNAPIHGFGAPMDNKLLVVHRAVDAPDSLPTHLRLYLRSGDKYTEDRLLNTRCNKMHGAANSGNFTAAGCEDGVLLAKHVSATTVVDSKVLTPIRIGTLSSHPKLTSQFIAIGSDGVAPAPVTTRFYAIDAEVNTFTEIKLNDWSLGKSRRAHEYDRTGTRFFVLDNLGNLTTVERKANAWVHLNVQAGVIPKMPAAAPWPTMVANGATDELYITDREARQIVVINSKTGQVSARKNLTYVPGTLTWTGINR
jgi:hypothetical protein